jgi:23S rRNA (uracil1939-C5)-methyltransferase
VKPGQTLDLDCDGLDDDGAATGDRAGVRLHVAGALPGERVTARVAHVSNHQPEAWASLIEIVAASPERRPPACRAYGACGGCVLQHFDYAGQLRWKTERVRTLMAAQADLALAQTPVADCVPSPRALGYRNRSKLVCARGDGDGDGAQSALVLGAFAPRSHQVVDLGGCRIAEAPLDEVAQALRPILAAADVAPYDERTMTGDLRYVILRVNQRGEVLATLVTARPAWPAARAVTEALRAARPEVIGVVQNVNPSRGNAIYGSAELTLGGRPTLEDAVGGVRVRLSSRAFFQANRQVAALAYAAIAAAVAPAASERVVDAYAGVGGIALTLAPAAREVIGVEEHAAAVDDAVASAALNGVGNATFLPGDAARRLRELERAEVVILNPPRKGCQAAVLAEVARLLPRRIAYLSCDPRTLARDLGDLGRRGYRALGLMPFDMLPHTPHVEVLAILEPG